MFRSFLSKWQDQNETFCCPKTKEPNVKQIILVYDAENHIGDNETSKATPSQIKWLSHSTLLMNGRDGPGWAFEEGLVSLLSNFLLITVVSLDDPEFYDRFGPRSIPGKLFSFFIGTFPCSLKCCGTEDISNGKHFKFRKPLYSFCNYSFNLARKFSNWKRFHSKVYTQDTSTIKKRIRNSRRFRKRAELLRAPNDSNLKPFVYLYWKKRTGGSPKVEL